MAGRPRNKYSDAQIKQIAELAFRGLKNNGIATKMGIDQNTFETHFKELCTKQRVERKLMLLDLQVEKAKTGDSTMLVWLGKNDLEQTDKQNIEHSGGITINCTKYAD